MAPNCRGEKYSITNQILEGCNWVHLRNRQYLLFDILFIEEAMIMMIDAMQYKTLMYKVATLCPKYFQCINEL